MFEPVENAVGLAVVRAYATGDAGLLFLLLDFLSIIARNVDGNTITTVDDLHNQRRLLLLLSLPPGARIAVAAAVDTALGWLVRDVVVFFLLATLVSTGVAGYR